MVYEAYEDGIEVSGESLQSYVDAGKGIRFLRESILRKHGVDIPPDGIDPEGWYSLQGFLNAFKEMSEKMDDIVLRDVGKRIPDLVSMPPSVTDIRTALRSVDLVYHMHHRKDGRVLGDPRTGRISEGIGHYFCNCVDGENTIIMKIQTPYPCALDRGLMLGFAEKFEVNARIRHEPGECRTKGGDICTYTIKW